MKTKTMKTMRTKTKMPMGIFVFVLIVFIVFVFIVLVFVLIVFIVFVFIVLVFVFRVAIGIFAFVVLVKKIKKIHGKRNRAVSCMKVGCLKLAASACKGARGVSKGAHSNDRDDEQYLVHAACVAVHLFCWCFLRDQRGRLFDLRVRSRFHFLNKLQM